MRREVPDDAHIALVQSQVDAAGRDEVNVAERSLAEQPLDCPHRGAVDERVSAHQGPVVLLGRLYKVIGKVAGIRQRFLDKHVLARLKRLRRQFVVGVHGRGDHDCVHIWSRHHAREVRGRAGAPIPAAELLQALVVAIAQPSDLNALLLGEDTQQVRSPISQPDHGNPGRAVKRPEIRH